MTEKIKAKDVYLSLSLTKAPDTNNLTIVGDKVRQGKVVSIITLFASDLTTSTKNMRIGFRRGGTDYWIRRMGTGTVNNSIILEQTLILVEGEQPVAMVESPNAGDECLLIARGPYLSE